MTDQNLAGLDPTFRKQVESVIGGLEKKNWKPRVASGYRSAEDQQEKVQLGYSKVLCSKHMSREAADIIDRRYGWKIAKTHAFWKDLGTLAKQEGLVWGGDWAIKDVAHIQTTGKAVCK